MMFAVSSRMLQSSEFAFDRATFHSTQNRFHHSTDGTKGLEYSHRVKKILWYTLHVPENEYRASRIKYSIHEAAFTDFLNIAL